MVPLPYCIGIIPAGGCCSLWYWAGPSITRLSAAISNAAIFALELFRGDAMHAHKQPLIAPAGLGRTPLEQVRQVLILISGFEKGMKGEF